MFKIFRLTRGYAIILRIPFFCMLLAAYCLIPAGNPYAQETGGVKGPPSGQLPSGVKVESLTPAHRQAVEQGMSKGGGQLTPEAIETLKKSPEFKDFKPEGAGEGVKGKEDKRIEEPPDEGGEIEVIQKVEKTTQPVNRFGFDFFIPARNRILALEKMISQGQKPRIGEKDAISGFVGPLDMVSSYVNATIPPQYILSPKDEVTIYYWGDLIELTNIKLVLDEKGEVSIPKVGRFVARGMTLTQFQNAVKDQLRRVVGKNMSLIATLDSLRSIQIFITGETFRPGSYAVSAVTTLFNALYAGGGPNDSGSLREIKLIRNNKTISIDFYNYLLKGDSKDDYPLQAGDTIFISKVGKSVSIEGEVNRPGIFELKEEEQLRDMIELANGIKPTGLLQRVQIRSVIPNRERVIVDVDMSKNSPSSNHEIFDGDSVMVSSIPPEVVNIVTIEGKVERPGVYELKKDMKVSDLFSDINRPLGEAYMERAEIIRLNEDRKTTTMVPIHLGKALAGDPAHDIRLAPMDKLVVYSRWDVKFLPARIVTITGSVQRPGDYERSEGMKIKDLLVKAGGVMPNTYMERADLLRYDFEKENTTIIPVSLNKVLNGEESDNIKLTDKDLLRVYTIRESKFIPPNVVTITGSVQRPGDYERSEGMKIKDLLVKAGGVMPNTYMERADLLRYDFEKESYINIPVNIKEVLDGNKSEDLVLQDRDSLRIYMSKETEFAPPHEVSIYGTVQRPGTYTRFEGMRISDLLLVSGGVLPGGSETIEVAKARSEGEVKIIKVNLESLKKGDESQNVRLDNEDVVMVRKKSEFYDKPHWVTINGEVKYPGVYPLYGKEDRIRDVIERAGGLTKSAYPKGAVFNRKREYIPSDEQRRDINVANNIIEALNDLELNRQLARNRWLLAKESGKEGAQQTLTTGAPVVASSGTPSEAAAIGLAPGVAQAAGQVAGGIVETFERAPGVVSKARKLGDSELLQSERVIINLKDALEDSEGNILLMDGDTINIPQKVETASVVGAVMRPTTIHFRSNTKMKYYINQAGGYTNDADEDKVLVMRVDGSIIPADNVKYIEEGDIIYVPPKVMSLEIVERIDKVIDVVKFTLVTAASVVAFVALIGLF